MLLASVMNKVRFNRIVSFNVGSFQVAHDSNFLVVKLALKRERESFQGRRGPSGENGCHQIVGHGMV